MDNTEEFRCISLCTGYAGIELGLRRVIPNLRTVAYVEVEAFACANLVTKIEAGLLDAAPIWTDIKTFDGRPFRKRVHIITAGYPCQPFSVAGKRQGTDDPRHLWPYIERIVSSVRPVWCFFENVSGHLSIGFPEVYRSLRNLGYKVEAGLFTAAEVGAPHKRERLFILASSQGIGYGGGAGISQSDKDGIQEPESARQQIEGGSSRSNKLANSRRTASGNQDGQIDGRTRQENVPQGNGQTGSVRLGAASGYWPSRPGRPQYEWEEPRVVLHSKSLRLERFRETRQGGNELDESNQGQAQSQLGRAVNGTACRVDRLRLLGKGVVPSQAELAFRTLMKLFKQPLFPMETKK